MSTHPDGTGTTVRLYPDGGDRPTLHIERHCAHPVARVWQAITDDAQISAWFGFPVRLDPVPGGRFAVTFSPDLVEEGRVLRVEPPRLLEYTGRDDVYRWELAATDGGCHVLLANTVGEQDHVPYSAAGFHRALWALDDLICRQAGRPGPPEPAPFDELVARYTAELRAPGGPNTAHGK